MEMLLKICYNKNMKKSNLVFTVLQIPLDAAMIFLALASSFLIRAEGQTEIYKWTFASYSHLVLLTLPLWIIIFYSQGLYRIKQPLRGMSEFAALSISVLASWAIYVVGLYFYRSENTMVMPRLILIYSLILSFAFVVVARWLLHAIQKLLYYTGLGVRQIMLIGNDNSITNFIVAELSANRRYGYRIAAKVREDELGNFDIVKLYHLHHFDEVIVSTPNIPDNKLLPILEFCENHNIVYKMVPNLFEVNTSHAQNLTFLGIPIVELIYTPLQGWGRIIKRIIDVFIATIAIIIASPFMLIIAILIKIESRGPVFYQHKRIGQDGKHFYLLKFRSMVYGADKQLIEMLRDPKMKAEFEKDFKFKNDTRVTRVGSILRKTSLDELPQFFNVIKGEMSLVGPRPIVEDEMDRYGIYQNKRHVVKPGITGMWQVSGRNDIAYDERIRLDSFYVENWTIWMDFSILFKTLFSFFKKDAY